MLHLRPHPRCKYPEPACQCAARLTLKLTLIPAGPSIQGTPKGSWEDLGGLRTYVTKPKDGSKRKTVVFLADIFGVNIPNPLLLADTWVILVGFEA